MIVLADIALGLIALLTILLAIVAIMTLFLPVPYVPTPKRIVRRMVELAKLKPGDSVLDPGAGDGRLLIEAKRREPGIAAVGCEIVPPVWLLSILYRFFTRSDITLKLQSAFTEDFSSADVLLLYLSPEFHRKLLPKLEKELKKGTRVVSYTFPFYGKHPKVTERVKAWGMMKPLYVYEW